MLWWKVIQYFIIEWLNEGDNHERSMREVNEIHGTAPFYCVASFATASERTSEREIKTMRKKLIVYCIE